VLKFFLGINRKKQSPFDLLISLVSGFIFSLCMFDRQIKHYLSLVGLEEFLFDENPHVDILSLYIKSGYHRGTGLTFEL
jgi:hypothetical protein